MERRWQCTSFRPPEQWQQPHLPRAARPDVTPNTSYQPWPAHAAPGRGSSSTHEPRKRRMADGSTGRSAEPNTQRSTCSRPTTGRPFCSEGPWHSPSGGTRSGGHFDSRATRDERKTDLRRPQAPTHYPAAPHQAVPPRPSCAYGGTQTQQAAAAFSQRSRNSSSPSLCPAGFEDRSDRVSPGSHHEIRTHEPPGRDCAPATDHHRASFRAGGSCRQGPPRGAGERGSSVQRTELRAIHPEVGEARRGARLVHESSGKQPPLHVS